MFCVRIWHGMEARFKVGVEVGVKEFSNEKLFVTGTEGTTGGVREGKEARDGAEERATDIQWADFIGYENGTRTSVQLGIRRHWERFLF